MVAVEHTIIQLFHNPFNSHPKASNSTQQQSKEICFGLNKQLKVHYILVMNNNKKNGCTLLEHCILNGYVYQVKVFHTKTFLKPMHKSFLFPFSWKNLLKTFVSSPKTAIK